MDPKIFAELRNALTKLYPDEASMRRLMADAGVDLARTVLNAAPANNWHEVLVEAERNERVEVLLAVVEREYGNNQEFLDACTVYRQAVHEQRGEDVGARRVGNDNGREASPSGLQDKRGGDTVAQSQGKARMQNWQNINLEKLMQAQFDAAKAWQSRGTLCGAMILLINIVATATNQLSATLAIVAALLTVLNAVANWRSDRLRGTAEETLRKFEMYKALGWQISSREIADLLAGAPRTIKEAASAKEQFDYFSSTSDMGPTKLLENLEESAWWSKHQARRMAGYAWLVGSIVFLIVLGSLVVTLQSNPSQSTGEITAQAAILVILFIISGGYIRAAVDYELFARQAEKAETLAHQLRKSGQMTEVEAIKLLHDYQIDRATSPLLPSWLWRIVQKELNALWEARVASEERA